MTSVSDTSFDLDKSQALRKSLEEVSAVNRSGRVFMGSALLISAFGLWLVPVDDGDTAMKLIKLAISIVLFGLGAMFISSISERKSLPEIQIDTQNREVRVVKATKQNGNQVLASYALDDLTEVTMKDELFSARDKQGEMVISVPVRDEQTEIALRSVLETTL